MESGRGIACRCRTVAMAWRTWRRLGRRDEIAALARTRASTGRPFLGAPNGLELRPVENRTGSARRRSGAPRTRIQQIHGGLWDVGFAICPSNSRISPVGATTSEVTDSVFRYPGQLSTSNSAFMTAFAAFKAAV